ncbi:ABC transporter permease [Chryseolinea lacunae]|uniref:ABC transporter permease n=1 Tax=Chryseolinea lacunae TaxID=2801331 RepID=A0ABS1KLH5_9BACT|nr:ABC transporter permease [Chryseolinea lacunae]MBL0740183.1 ABC transporter permease [Chryseolinea lacunae]
MVKNYLKIVLRFMLRHKGYSMINIAGLTIGITCTLLIILYIRDELSYDRFHPDADDTYRIGFSGAIEGRTFSSAQTGGPVAAALQKEIPDVASTLRMACWATFPVRYQDRVFTEAKLLLADENFFRFFHFNLVEGHPDSVLHGDGKVVITESAARRYFDYKGKGDKTPIGKSLVLAQGYIVKVSGIAEDPPLNSHFRFTLVLSLISWDEANTGDWMTRKLVTYAKLKPGASPDSAMAKFNALTEKNVGREVGQGTHQDWVAFTSRGNRLHFFAQPLPDIHLHSQLSDEIEVNGDIQYIYIFGSIAVLVTLLACINFMNLSTARSSTRAKEVGVRKTVGAPYGKLVGQFLVESYCYVLISVGLSLFGIVVLLPVLNYFTEKQLHVTTLFRPVFFTSLVLFVMLVGLLAGSYPAYYLSRFNPVEVLTGKLRIPRKGFSLRNVLVVFQFFISTVLIIATLAVYEQLRFIQRAALGFDKANVVNLLHTKNLRKNGITFKRELMSYPEISSASYANRLPPQVDWQSVFRPVDSKTEYLLAVYEMDADHLETMRYTLAEGRFFSSQIASDSNAIILNQTAAKKLGWEKFKGKKLVTNYDHDGRAREVIGILQDFNFQSLKEPVQPLAVVLGPEPNWEMAIRITKENTEEKLALIRTFWKKYAPDAPFEYVFLDKNFEAKQAAERKLGTIFFLFTSLAIFIACLGLLGLASFKAEQATKEIGIRKVMGATVNDIVLMMNRDFLKLVVAANVLAWPVAAWAVYVWLNQFAYRISFPWLAFLLAGVISFVIAFAAVGYQAGRAARGNPVKSLRNE